jgi:hypothetical protein
MTAIADFNRIVELLGVELQSSGAINGKTVVFF